MSLLRKKDNSSQHWLTISDLMSGLMIIFIFIAISFMRSTYLEKEKVKKIEIQYEELILKDKNLDEAIRELNEIKEKNDVLQLEKDKLTEKLAQLDNFNAVLDEKEKISQELTQIRGIAEAYQNNQLAIYEALKKVFPDDELSEDKLNAEIDKETLTFIFKSSDSLFDNASANLKEKYKQALTVFFPKYIQAILPYKDSISEIRIEGHTSSEWNVFPKEIKNKDMDIKDLYGYFGNMNLSQDRTNSVLNYVLNDLRTEIPNEYRKWLRDHTAAVGLSSSKPILDENGNEDKNKSRRVTFRIITNADSKIQQILQQ
ncbi:Outer membrane protein and related peptidoglycan-associated (lipo)proteins [Haemophilus parahaemolyticus]|uniref:Outer membrane protein and related peptidoglycan-associated (Lipo)proteins n=1 Tax=Haemophilus parahaemolyticus TaxID=735 RepID=A0A377HYA1_HAEPH|nr:OmpA family protein [Haemophilus parahaemolyticus]STO63081.1 Outer membrane protein and related peptidoglycan-associated (lipo)proteins [Haemophilus parahaemolyticus]